MIWSGSVGQNLESVGNNSSLSSSSYNDTHCNCNHLGIKSMLKIYSLHYKLKAIQTNAIDIQHAKCKYCIDGNFGGTRFWWIT